MTTEPREEDVVLMRRALELARRAEGQTRPNPIVGAVISRDGRIIAEGWHERAGKPHAERQALAACVENPRGATLYVTLEPCCHQGRTPPCTVAVLDAGIARVVVAAMDPNPLARGGATTLRDSGVEVVTGVLGEQARLLNPAFHTFHALRRPLVTLKWAISADGCTSAAGGDSKWITGTEARTHAHLLRAQHDATLAGIETVLRDNARLSVRDAPTPPGPPLRRVVLDSTLRLPPEHPFVTEQLGLPIVLAAGDGPEGDEPGEETPLAERAEALRDAGVEVRFLPRAGDGVGIEPGAVLELLAGLGVQSVLVEGGRRVAASFLAAGLADRVAAFVAPTVIGAGTETLSALLGAAPRGEMSAAIRLARPHWKTFGDDALLTGWIGSHLLDGPNSQGE